MPHDTCLHCGRPRRRIVRSQKYASAWRRRWRLAQFQPTMQIYCTTPSRKHKFSKDTA